MTLLSRAPRQVYRVYDEAEFLAVQTATTADPAPSIGDRSSLRLRIFAPAVLVITACIVGLLSVAQLGLSTRRPRHRDGHSRLRARSRLHSSVATILPVSRGNLGRATARSVGAAKGAKTARSSPPAIHASRRESHPSARPEAMDVSSGDPPDTTTTPTQPPEFGLEQGSSR